MVNNNRVISVCDDFYVEVMSSIAALAIISQQSQLAAETGYELLEFLHR